MALNYRRFGGAHEVAEDASQEVFLRLVRYAPFERIKGAAAFYAYVRKVCANVAADYRLQIGRLREVQALEELTLEHPESQRLDLSVEADRLKEELLSQLTDTDQRLAQLILEGFSLNEIAETLGIGYSSAGVRVHRLRQRMAKLLR
jgi:RNA polymerase sigma-70 factor (ECF subfamily)